MPEINTELLKEIAAKFNTIMPNRYLKLETLPDDNPGWVIAGEDWIGVAIPCDFQDPFYDKFTNATLDSQVASFADNRRLLRLICRKRDFSNEFSYLCAQFADLGENGANRSLLKTDPAKWTARWKSLLGNAISEKNIYPVLAELLVCEVLLDGGLTVDWRGPNGATVDIAATGKSYEVKSSLKRDETRVEISSVYQLATEQGRELSLIFCRMEPASENEGECINDVVERLVTKGFSRDALEELLDEKAHLPLGFPGRKKTFKLHEMREYAVDDNFPKVTLESFKGNRLPESISDISYSVNLVGLPYEPFGK